MLSSFKMKNARAALQGLSRKWHPICKQALRAEGFCITWGRFICISPTQKRTRRRKSILIKFTFRCLPPDCATFIRKQLFISEVWCSQLEWWRVKVSQTSTHNVAQLFSPGRWRYWITFRRQVERLSRMRWKFCDLFGSFEQLFCT